ncbi:hypothetical protein [Streptomyces sp. HD]|uniref:hypothetical protein n=1 Tax=Streptomyces sp. HD TaxID=3020892 RepID=UPI00232C107B|nr:hypothetical protein [Streptomyces sp. HD]MDC0770758.1 hypothetical protein [Streptomyces sp. HD]
MIWRCSWPVAEPEGGSAEVFKASVTDLGVIASGPCRAGRVWAGSPEAVAALLLHLLTEAKPAPEDLAVVHHTLDAWHRELGAAAEAAGIPDPWAAADLIYLVSRGAMLSTLEHPGTWTTERLTTAAGNLNRLLRPGSAAPAQPTRQKHSGADV